MQTTTAKPQGVAWVIPHIIVKDVNAILPFYQKAFGFEILESIPGDDGIVTHAEMRYQDQLLMLGKSGAYGGTTKSPIETGIESPMNLYLYCENVDKYYENALSMGAKSLTAPELMFWGDKMCRVLDPEGYIWCFATHVGATAGATQAHTSEPA